MLKLQSDQLKAFGTRHISDFIKVLEAHLQKLFPPCAGTARRADWRGFITPLVRTALDHGIETEYGICLWIEIAAAHVPSEDVLDNPQVLAILHGGDEEDVKLRRLLEVLDVNARGSKDNA